MARALPLVFLFVAAFAAAASLDERAYAAFARLPLRPDQQAPYETIVRDYYQHMNDMLKRAMSQNSGEMLQKLVRSRGEKISDDAASKMSKVLDDKQMEDFRYALDLANRSYVDAAGTQ